MKGAILDGAQPVILLPNVSWRGLREPLTLAKGLQTLVEMQYRGDVFRQRRQARDWTVATFLRDPDQGLGLAVETDSRTDEAARRALPAARPPPRRMACSKSFACMAFLLEQFKDASLKDPTDRNHCLDLKAMATRFAETYKEEKSQSKELGLNGLRALPGVHHPIFKGKPINYDPRERFIAEFMEKRGDYNVFHAFYLELVQALYDAGATRYVFCVNVDAVIAALLLAVLWKEYRSGVLTEKDLEMAAFNVFLYGRMIGAAAEIDDHLNRGRNMDTRTPQEQCAFVV